MITGDQIVIRLLIVILNRRIIRDRSFDPGNEGDINWETNCPNDLP